MDYRKEFGRRLRLVRVSLGMKIPDMAKLLGCSYGAIREYEIGSRIPPMETVMEIAEKLNVPVAWLIGGGTLFGFQGVTNETILEAMDENAKIILGEIEALRLKMYEICLCDNAEKE